MSEHRTQVINVWSHIAYRQGARIFQSLYSVHDVRYLTGMMLERLHGLNWLRQSVTVGFEWSYALMPSHSTTHLE